MQHMNVPFPETAFHKCYNTIKAVDLVSHTHDIQWNLMLQGDHHAGIFFALEWMCRYAVPKTCVPVSLSAKYITTVYV